MLLNSGNWLSWCKYNWPATRNSSDNDKQYVKNTKYWPPRLSHLLDASTGRERPARRAVWRLGYVIISGGLPLNKWRNGEESKAVSRMRTVQVFDSLFWNPLPRQLLASGSFAEHTLCPPRTRGGGCVVLRCLILTINSSHILYLTHHF
jgi:hypothetical protein